jgi:hypothetical protein
MRGWAIGPDQQEQIGKVLGGDSQVSYWKIAKLLVDLGVVSTMDFKMGSEGRVEPGGTDNHVDFVLNSILVHNASRGKPHSGGPKDLNVVGLQRLQVSGARGHSTASQSERGYQVFGELLIMPKLLGHDVGHKISGGLLIFRFEMHLDTMSKDEKPCL